MRRVCIHLIVVVITTVICFTSSVFAETVYVRDTLYVPIRGGQSTEYRILHKGVRSGTKLEKLEENSDTGYSLVRMVSGLEGWIQTQYLDTQPIAQDVLKQTTQELVAIEEKHQNALRKLKEADVTQIRLLGSEQRLQSQNAELTTELGRITRLAASVMDIDEENKRLTAENESLLAIIDEMQAQNLDLQEDSNQDWFLRGAGTVLIGLLFGFWFARRIYQKRNTGGWA